MADRVPTPPSRDQGAADPPIAAVEDDDEDLLSYDPQWCLFWDAAVPAFHLDIWLPYLRRSRYRYVVMAGEDRFSDAVRTAIAGVPNVRIVEPYKLARTWLQFCPSFRGVLYVGNRPENLRMANAFRNGSHVFLGHGESDKHYSGFRAASLYDSIFVARYGAVGRFPPAIRRWVAAGACAIGAPILDGALKDPWTSPRPIRTILYAPTWEGHSTRGDYTSLPEVGPAIIEAMPDLVARGIRVILRPHPTTGMRLAALKAIPKAILAAGAEPGGAKAADFAAADVIISDISGITAEFLFTEKPSIMPATDALRALDIDDARLAAEYPWVDRWDVAGTPLLDRLAALETTDPLRGARAKAARDLFHGHRSIEEAAHDFDLALDSVAWRRRRLPVRWVYEAKRRIPRRRDPRPARIRRRST